jgi:hypothetical protein
MHFPLRYFAVALHCGFDYFFDCLYLHPGVNAAFYFAYPYRLCQT